jgi:hypothetical protein
VVHEQAGCAARVAPTPSGRATVQMGSASRLFENKEDKTEATGCLEGVHAVDPLRSASCASNESWTSVSARRSTRAWRRAHSDIPMFVITDAMSSVGL